MFKNKITINYSPQTTLALPACTKTDTTLCTTTTICIPGRTTVVLQEAAPCARFIEVGLVFFVFPIYELIPISANEFVIASVHRVVYANKFQPMGCLQTVHFMVCD